MGILERILHLPGREQEEADRRWEKENCKCDKKPFSPGVNPSCPVHGDVR